MEKAKVDGEPGMTSVSDGLLDFCMGEGIVPLAYSPIAKAVLSREDDSNPRVRAVQDAVGELAQKYQATRTQIAIAWLLAHPSGIIPIVGSANPAHIAEAAQAVNITLARLDWYQVFTASWGRRVP